MPFASWVNFVGQPMVSRNSPNSVSMCVRVHGRACGGFVRLWFCEKGRVRLRVCVWDSRCVGVSAGGDGCEV